MNESLHARAIVRSGHSAARVLIALDADAFADYFAVKNQPLLHQEIGESALTTLRDP
jgi:hypothetical protein